MIPEDIKQRVLEKMAETKARRVLETVQFEEELECECNNRKDAFLEAQLHMVLNDIFPDGLNYQKSLGSALRHNRLRGEIMDLMHEQAGREEDE